MSNIEVMKQTLAALHRSAERMLFAEPWSAAEIDIEVAKKAIANLRAAIEEAEKQEPVAEVYRHGKDSHGRGWHGIHWYDPNLDVPTGTKLYTHPAPAVPEGWIRAIDEAMVCSHLGVANVSDTYEDAKKKLNSLIYWNIDVATNPAVNGGWQLVPKEPTFEMIHAGTPSTEGHYSLPVSLYKSMLAAAPKPEW